MLSISCYRSFYCRCFYSCFASNLADAGISSVSGIHAVAGTAGGTSTVAGAIQASLVLFALSGAAAVFPAVICAPAVSVPAVAAWLPHPFLASLRLLGAPAVVRFRAVAGFSILAGVPAVFVVPSWHP